MKHPCIIPCVFSLAAVRVAVCLMTSSFSCVTKGSYQCVSGGFPKTKSSLSRSKLGATWSNGQAIREYQDFLSSGKSSLDLESDGPSVILTDGLNRGLPVALFRLGMGDDLVLSCSNAEFPSLPATLGGDERTSYPIYVAVSPSTLPTFLANMRNVREYLDRYEDFVFFSGGGTCGCIEPVLKDFGFCRDSTTQVLISGMTLPKDENDPTKPHDISVKIGADTSGGDKWAGECAACGKWQGSIAERLERNSIRCKTGFYREWRRLMWERAAFDAVFNLVGSAREKPTTFADVSLYYGEEVSDMLWQIATLLRGRLAVTMTYGFEERMFDLAEKTGKETFCSLSREMYPFTYWIFEEATMVAEYVKFCVQERGLLSGINLSDAILNAEQNVNTIMRQGNLRADGAL